MNYDTRSTIRDDQIRLGREISRAEREHYTHGPARPPMNRPPSKSNFKPKKPNLEGHESFLAQLKESGGKITVVMRTLEDTITGVVAHADKFTISLIADEAGPAWKAGDKLVIFKHDIALFLPTGPRPTFPEIKEQV